jgi:GNAT superfamily N-acetyltransferase
MTIRYSVQPFGPEIVEAYGRLFPEFAADKSPALLSWRFERSPHGPGLFAVARDESDVRIIGMIALVATRLRIGAGTQLAYQAIDTVVDPNYRGKGVFVGLGEAAQNNASHEGHILWGFPNANAAPGWFGKLKWQNLGTVPFMVRPLRAGYFLRKLLPFLGQLDMPLVLKPSLAGNHRTINRFGDEADALWNVSRPADGIAVDRDAAWLNWRLLDKPNAAYRLVGAYDPDGRLAAFASSCTLNKHGGRICYITEAMAPPAHIASLSGLIRDEVARSAERGADVALAWCPKGSPNRRAYRRAGFFPLPERLRPVEIHFGARSLASETASAVEDGSKWYLSYLDSDTV